MKNDLLRFNFNQKYITFDAETEGLNLLYSRPWQIAWVEAVGKKITARKELHIYWPDLKVSDEAAKITGFNYDKYRSLAISPEEAWEEFRPHLKDESVKIIGQNILGFDVYMLNSWHRAMGRGSLDFSFVDRILDTKAMAMAIAKGCKSVGEDDLICWQYRWLNYREKGIKTSQAHLLKMYEIPHDAVKLHDALYDVEMTFQIFQKQIFELEI
jgi:DNA polymerase III epsilon subunit-like protein